MPMNLGLGLGLGSRGDTLWWLSGSELDFDFANNRAFNRSTGFNGSPNGILTYTSPSPKMVYGDDGVLGYAPHNLLTYSTDFSNAAWLTNGNITKGSAVTDPAGGTTARTVTASGANGDIYQTFAAAPDATVGIWIKRRTGSGNIQLSTPGNVVQTVAVTSDWAYFTQTGATSTGGTSVGYLVVRIVTSGDAVDIAFPRAYRNPNHATSATYVPTTSAAVYSLPIDHDPITFEPLGVLIEEQRTNLLLRSQELADAFWATTSLAVTSNAATAPDGTATADKLVPAAASSSHNLNTAASVTVVASTAYSKTFYVHASGYSKVGLREGAATGAYAAFDLSLGTVLDSGSGGTGTIEALGGSWYRIGLSLTTTGVQTTYGVRLYVLDPTYTTGAVTGSWTADGVSGVDVWGAQLEAGAFPTSYIPTVASQVTRAADQVSILTSAFAYNAAAGSYAVEADGQFTAGTITTWFRDDNIVLTNTASGVRVYNSASSSLALLGSYTPGTTAKVAVGYMSGASASAGSIAGAAVVTFTNPGDTATTLLLGRGNSGVGQFQLNGHIKRLTYFPTRKTNAELQALSA